MIGQFGQNALANKKGGNLALSPNSDSDSDDSPKEGESKEDARKRR
jgi:hypothetical protein